MSVIESTGGNDLNLLSLSAITESRAEQQPDAYNIMDEILNNNNKSQPESQASPHNSKIRNSKINHRFNLAADPDSRNDSGTFMRGTTLFTKYQSISSQKSLIHKMEKDDEEEDRPPTLIVPPSIAEQLQGQLTEIREEQSQI